MFDEIRQRTENEALFARQDAQRRAEDAHLVAQLLCGVVCFLLGTVWTVLGLMSGHFETILLALNCGPFLAAYGVLLVWSVRKFTGWTFR